MIFVCKDLVFVGLLLVAVEDAVEVQALRLELLVAAAQLHFEVFDHDDVADVLQVLDLVRDQHNLLVPQKPVDAALEQHTGHVRVDGAQRVVEQVHVGVGVARAGQADPGFLAAAGVDAALADLGVDAPVEDLQVVLQSADVDDSVEALFVEVESEQDVLFERARHDERLLLDVGHPQA